VAWLLCALLALHGAWRCTHGLDWRTTRRLVVTLLTAVPLLGLFGAAFVVMARRR
jgi:hypothetical protein